MLLNKIRLKNFISHRVRKENGNDGFTEIDLDSSPLWLIHGENGSGKSSLWDALTFALFRQHRGGAQKFEQLIHHAEDEAVIELEFKLGNDDYQIVSVISRNKPTWDILNCKNGDKWVEVKGTKNKVKNWIAQNIKLKHETFTSSVLLLQGKADSFLLADPSVRKDRLIDTLQLDIYKQLSKKANKHKDKKENERDHLQQTLKDLPQPTNEDVEAQERVVTETEERWKQAETAFEKKKDELSKIKEAAEKRAEIEEKRRQQEKYRKLIDEGEEIEKNVNEFRKLKDVLPRLKNFWEARSDLNIAETKLREHENNVSGIAAQLEALDTKIEESKRKEAEAKTALKKAESGYERFEELSKAIDSLDEFSDAIEQLKTARGTHENIRNKIADLSRKEEQFNTKAESLKRLVEEANTEYQRISKDLEDCRRELAVKREKQKTRNEVSREDECPTCGTELSSNEAHERMAHQLSHLQEEISDLEDEETRLSQKQDESLKAFGDANARHQAAEKSLQVVQRDLAIAKSQLEKAEKDISTAEKLVRKRETQAGVWSDQLVQLESLKEEKEKLSDSKQTRINATSVFNAAYDKRDRLERDHLELKGKLETEKRLREEAETQKINVAKKLEGKKSELSEEWLQHEACENEDALNQLYLRLQILQGSEKKETELREALKNKEQLETEINLLESQIKLEYERPVVEVDAECKDAEAKSNRTRQGFTDARDKLNDLKRQKKEAETKQKDLAEAEQELFYWKTLSEDFGAKGIQALIVKNALATIAVNANTTLAQLTGGEWQIEFEEISDTELEINALNLSQGFKRTFKFISGGERFCVAVSIAIAIGQTLQEGRTVDTLIIDEGFGQLDDKHRSSLVKELGRLSNEVFQGGRIVVVSHQDNVKDEFANCCYRIVKDADGYVHIERGLN